MAEQFSVDQAREIIENGIAQAQESLKTLAEEKAAWTADIAGRGGTRDELKLASDRLGTRIAMAEAEDQMTTAVSAILGRQEEQSASALSATVSGYFSQARLTRQQSRDQALSLLEMAASAESASQETLDAAMSQITEMANWSLLESRIENELLAKNFADCVVYLSAQGCTVAVPAPSEGLDEADVARITDAVIANSEYTMTQINVIEVMDYQ